MVNLIYNYPLAVRQRIANFGRRRLANAQTRWAKAWTGDFILQRYEESARLCMVLEKLKASERTLDLGQAMLDHLGEALDAVSIRDLYGYDTCIDSLGQAGKASFKLYRRVSRRGALPKLTNRVSRLAAGIARAYNQLERQEGAYERKVYLNGPGRIPIANMGYNNVAPAVKRGLMAKGPKGPKDQWPPGFEHYQQYCLY